MTKSQFEEFKSMFADELKKTSGIESIPKDRIKINKPKEKMEFSKKWLIILSLIASVFTTISYSLSFFNKNPVENLSIELVRIIWGVNGAGFIGYNLQNCVRAWSSNKFTNNLNIINEKEETE